MNVFFNLLMGSIGFLGHIGHYLTGYQYEHVYNSLQTEDIFAVDSGLNLPVALENSKMKKIVWFNFNI